MPAPAAATKSKRATYQATAGQVQPRRREPKRRRVDGIGPGNAVINPEEGRKYVLVFKGDLVQGISYYAALGYEIEYAEDPKENPRATRMAVGETVKPGDPIEYRGHVLMSIHEEDWLELDRNGPDGATGQRLFDELDKRIRKTGAVDDYARGTPSALVKFDNSDPQFRTSALRPELE